MKTKEIFYAVLSGVILLVMVSCNKDGDDFFYSGDIVTVKFNGYNGSDKELEVKIDTAKMKSSLKANSLISESSLYTFYGNQNDAKVTIREKGTGKLVFEKEIKRSDKETTINLGAYIDGKVITGNSPAPDPKTNKLGFYIVNSKNNFPYDLLLLDESMEKVLTTLGTNITPNKWVYFDIDYTTTKKPDLQVLMFYNVGTARGENDGYFENSIWQSYLNPNIFFPTDGTKGVVREFIVIYVEDAGLIAVQI